MLYPKAIDDDDELPSETDSSSDEEIEATKARKKKKRVATDFSDKFTFTGVDVVEEDHLDGLKKFLEKRTPSSLQNNIEKERDRLKSALVMDIIDEEEDVSAAKFNGDGVESDSDDSLVQEHTEKEDKVRDKSMKIPKNKLKANEFFDEASKDIVEAAGKQTTLTFQEMNLSRPILKAITAVGYVNPTPIQTACIPVGLAGRDICACSATGTGKTAAFMLPILERLLYKPRQKAQTRVLVLVPTRELAIQVFQVSRKLAQFTGVEVCLCAGGLDLKSQEAALKMGLDVVIATPGRLIDHVANSTFSLSSIEVLVLDEADRMLDENFSEQMKEIIRLCSKSRQTMLFSATMTDEIEELAKLSLDKPVRLFINENTQTAANLRQEFIRIRSEDMREAIVCALVTRNFPDHTMVFMKSKKDCARMHVLLGLLGVKCAQLHGSLSQTVRVQSLQKFKTQEIDVLVCTELAARGLDIEGVLTVINMHMPQNVQQYIHRVGRTARAGKAGRAISLIGEDDRKLLKSIVKYNKNSVIKQRNIAPEVISAYKERISGLEPSIEKVQNEAVLDNQIRMAEEKLAKVEKRLITGESEEKRRNFIKKPSEIKKEVREKMRKEMEKNRKKKEREEMTEEDRAAMAEAAYQAREMKRMRKPKKMRAIVEDEDEPKKKKKKKSTFTSKLTDVSKSSVKKFRFGPDDQEFREAKRDKALNARLKGKNKRKK